MGVWDGCWWAKVVVLSDKYRCDLREEVVPGVGIICKQVVTKSIAEVEDH